MVPDLVDDPQPGFWLVRLVKGGPTVPARIFWGGPRDPVTREPLDRPPVLQAEVAGLPEDDVFAVWHTKRQAIPESEYRYRTDTIRWARRNRPDMPECHPRRRVSMLDLPPVGRFGE